MQHSLAGARRLAPALSASVLIVVIGLIATLAAGSNTSSSGNATSTPLPFTPTLPPATTSAFPTSTAVAPSTTTAMATAVVAAPTTAAAANASTTPVYTPSPTDAGFLVGVRLFTVTYRIEGSGFAAVLAQAYGALSSAVQVDMAGNLGTMTQLVGIRRLEEGSLVIEADIHADGSAAASPPADQRAALDSRYLTTAHDFASVRAVYSAINGATGEQLRTVSINMTNRDDSLGVPAAGPAAPPPPTEADFSIETCGFACGVFIAAVVIFACAIGGVVAYLACCRAAAPAAKPQPAGLHSLKKADGAPTTAGGNAAP